MTAAAATTTMRLSCALLFALIAQHHVAGKPQQQPGLDGVDDLLPSADATPGKKPDKTVKLDDYPDKNDKNKNPLLKEESGLWPFVTHITRTQIISTDSYCYRTKSKTVPILSITLPNPTTEQCRRKRAIDTASIMGQSAATAVARAIS